MGDVVSAFQIYLCQEYVIPTVFRKDFGPNKVRSQPDSYYRMYVCITQGMSDSDTNICEVVPTRTMSCPPQSRCNATKEDFGYWSIEMSLQTFRCVCLKLYHVFRVDPWLVFALLM